MLFILHCFSLLVCRRPRRSIPAFGACQEVEQREDEFERYLLAKGIISSIPPRDETDEAFDAFEPIEVEGEPLSEMIIRERR